jgi:excinuclease ABC subunit A
MESVELNNDRIIRLRGVCQHNLKNLNLDVPLFKLIAVSGVSGSGKSSLALHTLYAEGQRRYVETFSPYARQFLERMDPPEAELIEGIPPSIAIESGTAVRSSRSTVGTITEINDYLKVLYARLAVPHCPTCRQPILRDTPESIFQHLKSTSEGSRVLITFPYTPPDSKDWPQHLIAEGFMRFYSQGKTLDLESLKPAEIKSLKGREMLVVVDRLSWGKAAQERVMDSLSTAFRAGRGRLAVIILPDEERWFSSDLTCAHCRTRTVIPPPTPNLFSFNSPLGACPQCKGFGRTIGVDMNLVIPDVKKSLRDGAIKPWGTDRTEYEELLDFCRAEGISVDVPFEELDEESRRKIVAGTKDYYGVQGFFEWLETKTYKMHVRVFLSRYRAYAPCEACGGTRYQDAALLYRLRGVDIGTLGAWSIERCHAFFSKPWPELESDPAAALLVSEIQSRLQFLRSVGLEYLSLDRQSRTLSGGEVQRVHLTRALGSALVNVLYVLDEPSVGLHPRDQKRLMTQLHRLVQLGNSVVVVEHDPDMIRFCDEVIDIGPGGGEKGGEVIYQGSPMGLAACERSLTGGYLGGRLAVGSSRKRRSPDWRKALVVKGASENNLKNITVRFPLGLLVGVSGVSGSGKSTLMEKTLYYNWLRSVGKPTDTPGACEGLEGTGEIDEMVLVDQQPIGRTPRANLLTYTRVLDPLRKLLAQTPEAAARGYSAAHFSFNVPGGRCELCKGEGFERVEMQFLADVFIRCPQCGGRRFKEEILDIRIQGLSIGDILECTAQELLERFADHEPLVKALEPIVAIGLDYLRLGQPLSTLSGGEAQRLKLVHYLASGKTRSTQRGKRNHKLFLLDEPTTGLHPHDMQKLLDVLQRLVDMGNTVLVVEHNLDLLQACDWLIDLGPEGGEGGGTVVVEGTPDVVSVHPESRTGKFLKQRFEEIGPSREFSAGPAIFDRSSSKHDHGTEIGEAHETYPEEVIRVHGVGESSLSVEPSCMGPAPSNSPFPVFPDSIIIRGAREHNLQLEEIRIPRDEMVVLTGLSGSGKSTLAFDVLFAEGQRRYLECLSSYVRQYFKILEKPDVDQILGLPPTVAIEQRTSQLNRRSTVATVTEIYHFLRLLYSKLGRQHCPDCGRELTALTFDQILSMVEEEAAEREIRLVAPLIRGRKGIYRELFLRLKKMGFDAVRVDGKWLPLEPLPVLARHREHDIEVLVAAVGPSEDPRGKLAEKVRQALALGGGSLHLEGESHKVYSEHLFCAHCRKGLAPLDPRLFSFNSRHGACPQCNGIGTDRRLNLERLLGPEETPLKDGLLKFLRSFVWCNDFKAPGRRMERYWIENLGVDPEKPLREIDAKTRNVMLNGDKGKSQGLLAMIAEMTEMDKAPGALEPLYDDVPCSSCGGERLNAQARSVRFKGWTLGKLVRLSISDFQKQWQSFLFEPHESPIAGPITKEILDRIAFLREVGLDYLSLDRSGDTLSGGETQRIRLAAQLGSNLRGICYILDEPTIGLHPSDNKRLLTSLQQLKEKGNTIVVVEHDAETMKRGDTLMELGPEAGKGGGRLVAQGDFSGLCGDQQTLTGQWFGHPLEELFEISGKNVPGSSGWLEFFGVKARNLKNVHVRIPLGTLTCVTGVSGAGKSTLVHEVIYHGLLEQLGRRYAGKSDGWESMAGFEAVHRVLEVDHNPIGRTPRSIPATYVGVWDEIRKLFAMLPEARARGFSPGRFSFNVKGGRCEDCKGQGESRVEMHFLPDVFVPCETCRGSRFNAETLSITYRDRNISDVLSMSVEEAAQYFEAYPKIARPLQILSDLGLGYLTLGQPSPTLSGGEAQRIKLAGELGSNRIPTLYILDEPTTGLHRADVKRLLDVLHALTRRGHTVVVIEHNMDLVWASDYVIDMGPGSGQSGGQIVAEGTPEEILKDAELSVTAKALLHYGSREEAFCPSVLSSLEGGRGV